MRIAHRESAREVAGRLRFSQRAIFPSAVCATALVERVIHHADVVTIEGESDRLRESETDAKARRAARKPPK